MTIHRQVVAIAGGTGGLGRTFLDVFQNDFEVIVLTHRSSTHTREVFVDYDDIQGMRDTLEKHHISTVVSTLSDVAGNAQSNLVEACLQSQAVKRFIPSSWFLSYPRRSVTIVYPCLRVARSNDFSAIDVMPPLANYFKCLDRLQAVPNAECLEWTVVSNGIFLDYFGMPNMPSTLRSACFIVDMQHEMIAIPGDGNTVVTLTTTRDVARHVTGLLKLPLGSWPKEYHIAGDRITLNEFVSLTKIITGRQLKVVYDEEAKLRQGKITALPSQMLQRYGLDPEVFDKYIAILETWIVNGLMDIEPTRIEGMPAIHTTTVKDMLEIYWKL